eukprot:CAMPEP_0114278996 /NCGR_PEP_ID=MMETSP0059-20121206/1636_1 /TAXON_ID=36894 /ORGANISM="Pyramimonas parkeae, Strain CCMP726" /LENGTH=319 /DNA_ID=CAMNT_0001399235 /DNA_START=184 /DNA_END=1143 /DNA_ORIENTATION=+
MISSIALSSGILQDEAEAAAEAPVKQLWPVAVVTGACGGIGGMIAAGLVERGYDVVCACRTIEQSKATAERIGARYLQVPCDLADLNSVQKFAQAVTEQSPPRCVQLLMLAAGMVGPPLSTGRTAQGHELNFGVNHLGHFHLAQCLLPSMRQSTTTPCVVSLTSTAALDVNPPLRLDDMDWTARSPHIPHQAYCESKAANILFVDELARREPTVAAYSVHPGPTATVGAVKYELPRRYQQRMQMSVEQLERQATQLGLRTATQAAVGPLWCATSYDSLDKTSGGFYLDADVLYDQPIAWRTASNARDLWNLSERLVASF